jgi:hypothetical protein
VLHRAAAALAKMRTDRLDPLRTRVLDAQEMAPVRVARNALDLDGLARERVRDVERAAIPFGDAVAAVAEIDDGEAFGHAALPAMAGR